jgi:hypothetical protein
MRSTKKLLRLWLLLPLSFFATVIMAQNATQTAAVANSGKTAWMIVGDVAFILMIANLKNSIKHIYINLFAKKEKYEN